MRKVFCLLVALTLILAISCADAVETAGADPMAPSDADANVEISAPSAILMDATTGKVFYEKQADERRAPASLVKMMTVRLMYKAVKAGTASWDDMVRVSERAWRTGGSRAFLEVGEKVSFKELLYAIVVASGNDASVAAAEHVAGSVEQFVSMMNQEARALGLKDTLFVDSDGLSDDAYMSARDAALLARSTILDFPESLKVYSTREYEHGGIKQLNRNRLLWKYDWVDGLKTGHTAKAGYSLVATGKRDATRFIAVVMGADSEEVREREAAELLNYGFGNYETVQVISASEKVGKARVWKGRSREVSLVSAGNVAVTVKRGTKPSFGTVIDVPRYIVAPVTKGQQLGELRLTSGGVVIANVPVLAGEGVERGGFFRVFIDAIIMFFSRSAR